ncbi:hypothetical protein V8F33_002429 [Rhypophila sp. PSN 637]
MAHSGLSELQSRSPFRKEKRVAHRGGYTPVLLRCRYLLLVLCYILFLLALLEYLFRMVPQIAARQITPPDRLSSSLLPGGVKRRKSFAPRRSKVHRRDETDSPSEPNFPVTTGCNTRTSGAPFSNQSVPDNNCPAKDGRPLVNILHLDPRGFAQLDTEHYIVHFRWNMVWVHDETGRNKIPVPPGMDISQRCTAYNADIVITDNVEDCQVLIQIIDYSEEEGVFYLWDSGPPMESCPIQQEDVAAGYGMGATDFIVRPPSTTEDQYRCWNEEATDMKILTLPKRLLSWPEKSLGDGPSPNGAVKSPSPSGTVITTRISTVSTGTTTKTGPDGRTSLSTFTTTIPTLLPVTTPLPIPTTPAAITFDGTVVTLTDSLGKPTGTVTELFTGGPGTGHTRQTDTDRSDQPAQPNQSGQPRPTASASDLAFSYRTRSTTIIYTNSDSVPTSTGVFTLTNLVVPGSAVSATFETVFDSANHVPITTRTRYILPLAQTPTPTRSLSNLMPSRAPRPLNTSSIFPDSTIRVDQLTWQAYLAGSFAPVVLTTILSLLVQALSNTVRATVPFMLLSKDAQGRRNAIRAEDSLLLSLNASNILRIDQAVRLTWIHKEPLLLFCSALQVLGIILVSLSSEAVGMTLGGGSCRNNNFNGCYMTLAIVRGPARACEGILVVTAVIVLGVIISTRIKFLTELLGIYKTAPDPAGKTASPTTHRSSKDWSLLPTHGTYGSPTSIFSTMAFLAGGNSRAVRRLLATQSAHHEHYGGICERRFIKGTEVKSWFDGCHFMMNQRGEIGLATANNKEEEPSRTKTNTWTTALKKGVTLGSLKRSYTSFTTEYRKQSLLELGLRLMLLAVLASLLSIISYYGSTQLWLEDPLEKFMTSGTLGTSFLFTGAGGVIDLFWDSFFSDVELLEPYRSLSHNTASEPSPAQVQRSARNLFRPARSSSTFSGLFRALANRNLFLSAVAIAGIFSKFLSILFANIPFRLTLTWTTFVVCTWTSVAVLGLMVVVLLSSFVFAKPYYMPVDPGTIAGRMYYVCDSWATRDLAGLADLDHEARKETIENFSKAFYKFGPMVGPSGTERIGVDYVAVGKDV